MTERNHSQLWETFLHWQNREPGRYSIAGGNSDDRWMFHLVVYIDGTLLYEVGHPDYAPISQQHPWRSYEEDLEGGFQEWEPNTRQLFGDMVTDFQAHLNKKNP